MQNNVEYQPEYLETLQKSVTPPDLTKVDTDSPETRAKRAERELYIREHLNAVRGLSLYERIIFVRENLFDTNVRGDRPSDIRRQNIGLMEEFPRDGFPETEYPYFVKLIDTLDSFINELPEEKQSDASIRLASIIYGIGIPSHMFLDGNGQTLRLVALSYIHEYSPNLRNNYLPQRLTITDPPPLFLDYADHIINSVGYLQDDPVFDSAKTEIYVATLANSFKKEVSQNQVLDLYKEYLTTGNSSTENVKNKWIREVFREAVVMFNETEKDLKIKLGIQTKYDES